MAHVIAELMPDAVHTTEQLRHAVVKRSDPIGQSSDIITLLSFELPAAKAAS